MTLVEALITLAIGAVLMLSLTGMLNGSINQQASLAETSDLSSQARFALDRIERQLRAAPVLILPAANTSGDILAFALDPTIDTDGDGFADADNDKDGRVNEDPGSDRFANGFNGLIGIDDDQDGTADETDSGTSANDDEDSLLNEDAINGIDDDGDGQVDEDHGADTNDDGCPGICGVDDDADGTADEGDDRDDDEDGLINEDWLDIVIVQQFGLELTEAWPLLGATDGTSFTYRATMQGVGTFSIQRITQSGGRETVRVELGITDKLGATSVFSRALSRPLP